MITFHIYKLHALTYPTVILHRYTRPVRVSSALVSSTHLSKFRAAAPTASPIPQLTVVVASGAKPSVV